MEQVRQITLERHTKAGKQIQITGRAVAFAQGTKKPDMLLAAFALPVSAAKAAAAMIRGGREFTAVVSRLGRSMRHENGYTVSISRLPKFNMAQVTAIANQPGLLLGDLSTALWGHLSSEAITTPIVREWLPAIQVELDNHSKILGTNSFGFDVNVAGYDSSHVDAAVSELLQKRKIFV